MDAWASELGKQVALADRTRPTVVQGLAPPAVARHTEALSHRHWGFCGAIPHMGDTIRARALAILLTLTLAGCTRGPELGILAAAGVSASFACTPAIGLRQTTLCGGVLGSVTARRVVISLALRPLLTPVKLGATTNVLALPMECQVLLFNGAPQPVEFLEVFDSPAPLYDAGSKVQFASLVMARNPVSRQSCFIFTRP